MKKFPKANINRTQYMEYVVDNIEIDGLNEYFSTDFENYYVNVIDNQYKEVIGVRNNVAYRVM
jgi:hypothetical protein